MLLGVCNMQGGLKFPIIIVTVTECTTAHTDAVAAPPSVKQDYTIYKYFYQLPDITLLIAHT